jgi:hypothetical protein
MFADLIVSAALPVLGQAAAPLKSPRLTASPASMVPARHRHVASAAGDRTGGFERPA